MYKCVRERGRSHFCHLVDRLQRPAEDTQDEDMGCGVAWCMVRRRSGTVED
ncbi:hypothetical protein Hanom_Chr06g00488921 [Helianthus anomalus]